MKLKSQQKAVIDDAIERFARSGYGHFDIRGIDITDNTEDACEAEAEGEVKRYFFTDPEDAVIFGPYEDEDIIDKVTVSRYDDDGNLSSVERADNF
ncbi:MAG: hypothetical protein LKK08_06235 [Bacteroidales bacterium]|jgi:hypothetical protein|nr:hypothetical protein [Bacteroidales bacterium]